MSGCIILTKKEKIAFAHSGKEDESTWLLETLSKKTQYPLQNSSWKVIRWLEYLYVSGKWNDAIQLRLLAVEHLIDPIDIITGKDSIQQIIKRVNIRQSYSSDQLAELPEWAIDLPKSIKLLNTCCDLVRHGTDLEICLARDGYREGYFTKVKNGQSFILAIRTRYGHSTAELNSRLYIVQHTGHKNSLPHRKNEKLLYAFLRRISKKYTNRNYIVPSQITTNLPFININEVNFFRNAVDAEAARLRAIIEINMSYVDIFRARVDAEAARLNTID